MWKNKSRVVPSLIMTALLSATNFNAFGGGEDGGILVKTPHTSSQASSDCFNEQGFNEQGFNEQGFNDYLPGLQQQEYAPSEERKLYQQTFIQQKTTDLIEESVKMLLQEIKGTPDSNTVISSEGLYQTLNAIRLGAEDSTAELLTSVMGGFQPSRNVTSSTTFLCREGITVRQEYLRQLQGINGEFIAVDFDNIRSCQNAGKRVNERCKNTTNGMIPEAFNYENLLGKQETAVILVNAIYFNKKFQQPFNNSNYQQFNTSLGGTLKVLMMNSTRSVQYIKANHFSAIALPYQQSLGSTQTCMLVVLPNEGMAELVPAELTPGIRSLKHTKRQTVNISFPAFKFETDELDLKPHLRSMGLAQLEELIQVALDNLRGNLKIEELKQKVVIEVDKEGTRAAAVTQSTQSDTPNYSPSFTCNRPFLYLIADNWDQPEPTILFAGKVADPTREKNN